MRCGRNKICCHGKEEAPHIQGGLWWMVCLLLCLCAAGDGPLYSSQLKDIADGEAPKDMAALNGTFVVKTVDGRKVLEIPGDPVDGYGLLFGPDDQSSLVVQSRIYATSTGKRMPEFGVGLGDSGGYKLWLMPAAQQLQLIKGDDVIARLPYASWKSGTWTTLKLQVRLSDDGKTVLQGKAWPADQKDPAQWMIQFVDSGEAPKGRASIWANTYSSTPIRFDDLLVSKPSAAATP
jgi:hypothetical protein